eukprot:s80_g29.t1
MAPRHGLRPTRPVAGLTMLAFAVVGFVSLRSEGFSLPLLRRRAVKSAVIDAPRVRVDMPASLMEVEEPLALEAARSYQAVELQVPSWVSEKPISTAFIAANDMPYDKGDATKRPPPLVPWLRVLLHGFDSSALEFRRLLPLLSEAGVEVYLVDLLGWGFGEKEDVTNFSPEAKRALV